MSVVKTKQIAEFGDFQTPESLARDVCGLLSRLGVNPKTIIEPTCGTGNFLASSLERFTDCEKAIGLDISSSHLETARIKLNGNNGCKEINLINADFFQMDWQNILQDLSDTVLVIGNPPWVTNSQLSVLESFNLPTKSNFQNMSGYDALTGKSNFDISEWMLLKVLQWLNGREAVMAMLCKTGVARKILSHAWKNEINLSESAIYRVDAEKYFGASVEACLLVCKFSPLAHSTKSCQLFNSFCDEEHSRTIGFSENELIASVELYERRKHLRGNFKGWRSGIKHDCAKIMELVHEGKAYRNGFGKTVEIEEDFLFPMLKGSEVANGAVKNPKRKMLVTQRFVGDDTSLIKKIAPKTWAYLIEYKDSFDKRRSVIYKNRPEFSIFGVGDYSFAKWKVVVAGLYKKPNFIVVGSNSNKPIVLDSTVYFLPCENESQAHGIASLLNSKPAREFFEAFIFWDAKRPITVDILRRLDLSLLAKETEMTESDWYQFHTSGQYVSNLPFI